MKWNFIFLLGLVLLLPGCRNSERPEKKSTSPPPSIQSRLHGCRRCHRDIRPGKNHDFACTKCHAGNPDGASQKEAHAGLIARPAHPDYMAKTCGRCHPQQVADIRTSLHFTLSKVVNLVRKHFGAMDTLKNLTEIPVVLYPVTKLQLADNMLRRRCLRCHVYSPGDDYAYTRRGTGCAACHMAFAGGKLLSHTMIRAPDDQQCLSCHYANTVGADYYGRFEQDFSSEYRTPFTTSQPYTRPYGVEYHNLVPDIHQQDGLSCIDCHSGPELMTADKQDKLSCSTCHQWRQWRANHKEPLPDNLTVENGSLVLTARHSGRKYLVPQLSNPAHAKYDSRVTCEVCHAQWSFNDSTTYLLLSETDDFGPWEHLRVQSSSEVENLLDRSLNDDADVKPVMRDGITGREEPGIWYKGFIQRRWENIIIRRDKDGLIKIFRPILDLRLSADDREGKVLFNNVAGNKPDLLPYTPHTTGPAGMLYRYRFSGLLDKPAPTRPEK